MKIYVRSEGGELEFPSFKDFQNMYRLNFISPDDMVRRETSDRWMRAGDLPELRSMMLYDRPSKRARRITTAVWLIVGLIAVGVTLQFAWVMTNR